MNRFSRAALVAAVAVLSACQQVAQCDAKVRSDGIQAEFDRVSQAVAGPPDFQAESCLGVLAFRKGDFTEAEAHDRQALGLARSDPDRAQEQQRLASALKYLHRSSEAIDLLQQALRTEAALGDHAAQATVSATLASIYSDAGDHRRAIEMSLASVGNLRSRSSVAATYNNVAMDYLRLQELPMASRYIDMAIEVDRSSGDVHQLGIHEINKGVILNNAQEYRLASQWLQQGIEQSRRSGDEFWMMSGEEALGLSLYRQGRRSEAIETLQEAAGLAGKLGHAERRAAFADTARRIALMPAGMSR
jgi:tetratricopeptide (TPR) repeat protein